MNSRAQSASEAIIERRGMLAEAMAAADSERNAEPAPRHGSAGRAQCLADANSDLSYLAEALAFDNRALFIDYVAWVKVLLVRHRSDGPAHVATVPALGNADEKWQDTGCDLRRR